MSSPTSESDDSNLSRSSGSLSDQEENFRDEKPYPFPYSKDDFGTGIYTTLNKDVICLPHPNNLLGRGLFARIDLPKGTFIWYEDRSQLESELISFEEMEHLRATDGDKFDYHCRYAFQVSESNLVAGDVESDASFFMNHSCDPNAWIVKENLITTRRDVRKGEELCYDYATSECKYLDFDHCVCGAVKCRGRVGTDDWAIPQLHEEYGKHFMPYILRRLAQRGVLDSAIEFEGI